jgi:zinc transporter
MTAPAIDAPSGLLHAYLLDGKGGASALDWAGVARWSPNDGVLWIGLDYSAADAVRWLEEQSQLEPLVRDALLDHDPRPRAVAHGEELLLIVRGINGNAGAEPEDMVSVRAYVEPRRIITLRRRVSRSLKSIAAELEGGRGPTGTAELVATLVERILEPVVVRVDQLGDEVAALEDQLLGKVRRELRGELASHRRHAIALRRFIAPQREAFARLPGLALPWFGERHRARMVEAADRLTRTVEELDAARDRAAVTQEELASRLAELTNQRLYVLSIITAVFLPIGFLVGFLDLEIGSVKTQLAEGGFWLLAALFAVIGGGELWLFRRKGWL